MYKISNDSEVVIFLLSEMKWNDSLNNWINQFCIFSILNIGRIREMEI